MQFLRFGPLVVSELLYIYFLYFVFSFSKGFTYLISLLKQTYLKELALVPLAILLFLNLQSPNYEQTTRPFDNEKLEQVIYQVDNSNDDILIYHGGLQTIALYSKSHSELEDIGYFEIGMGTEGYHIPIFKKIIYILAVLDILVKMMVKTVLRKI